jgi:acyl dehydratase
MSKQVYFEDITAGDEIPHRVVETLTTRSIVKWAAAVKDFYEIHYDKDFARAVGMRDVIAHGPNKCALLSRLLLEWMGEGGKLHRISCTHKASNYPGDKLTCRGRIKEKYVEGGRNYVKCEVWVENQDGVIAAPGTALISLPVKNS